MQEIVSLLGVLPPDIYLQDRVWRKHIHDIIEILKFRYFRGIKF